MGTISTRLLDAMKGPTYCGGSIHYGVLAHEPSLGIIENDKLDRLVDPAIAEPQLNAVIGAGNCAMPQATRELDNVRGFLSVEADNKRRRVNVIDDIGVVRIRTEVFIVLRKVLSKKEDGNRLGYAPWPRYRDWRLSACQRLGIPGWYYPTHV